MYIHQFSALGLCAPKDFTIFLIQANTPSWFVTMEAFSGFLLRIRRLSTQETFMCTCIYMYVVTSTSIQITETRDEHTFSAATKKLRLIGRIITRTDALNTMVKILEHLSLLLKI